RKDAHEVTALNQIGGVRLSGDWICGVALPVINLESVGAIIPRIIEAIVAEFSGRNVNHLAIVGSQLAARAQDGQDLIDKLRMGGCPERRWRAGIDPRQGW